MLMLRFRKRQWLSNELSRWLSKGISADPRVYSEYWRKNRQPFFFAPSAMAVYRKRLQAILGEKGYELLVEDADNICSGSFQYFFAQWGSLGLPPDWHYNPVSGQRTSPGTHWSRIPIFTDETGDIKFIWEPGRFASAYTLVRAYWLTGDEKYAETFWKLIESFHESNPPNHGAHWKCGQEISLRLMAWCFALYAFADSSATTPERLHLLVGMMAAQADRVARDHIYAYLQQNNHAISEGVGLWTIGLLFPELKKAADWREAGRKYLEKEAKRQIYDDGTFVQQSFNYHRLMLQDYLWAIRLGETTDCQLSAELKSRVSKAAEFLYQHLDCNTGFTPNYGANDGALILPVNQCDYRDFRPVTATLHYSFNKVRLYENGPWDEDLLWFFGPDALEADKQIVKKYSVAAPVGGYYTLRGEKTWGMIRCGNAPDRPSNPDMLHLDIWRNGVNVACDAGSYLYYANKPWNNVLASTCFHNTVSVNGLDQSERGPRFLRLDWHRAVTRKYLNGGNLRYFEGEHNGYMRLEEPLLHRRAVIFADPDTWIIIDDLLGNGIYDLSIQWLLADLPYRVQKNESRVLLEMDDDSYELMMFCLKPADAKIKFDVIRGNDDTEPRGWQSLYYGTRQPAISAVQRVNSKGNTRIVSVFAPGCPENCLKANDNMLHWETAGLTLDIKLLMPGKKYIAEHITLKVGNKTEQMYIMNERKMNAN